jgi:hypothetical protein
LIASAEPEHLSLEESDGIMSDWGIPKISRYMIAANSRTRSDRAAKLFGYSASAPTVWDVLEEDMEGSGDTLMSAAFGGK